MSFSSEKPAAQRLRTSSMGPDVAAGSRKVQLKQELGGLSYEEQRSRLQPNATVVGGSPMRSTANVCYTILNDRLLRDIPI